MITIQRCPDHNTLYHPNAGCSLCRAEDQKLASQLASGMKEDSEGLCKRGDMGKLMGERYKLREDDDGR